MRKLILLLAVAVLAVGPIVASEKEEVMVPIHQFVDGFNQGDVKAAAAACAEDLTIIDDIPPHTWHGKEAFSAWLNDYAANAKKNGISDGVVTLSKPHYIQTTGDNGYAVVPADYFYKQNGKKVKEKGSTLTVALHKTATGWRITGWAWSKH